MALPEVRMSFPDRAALERELDQNLRHGRAFLNQASDVPVLSECVLVLVHPEHAQELRVAAQVVMVNPSGPMCGIGLALRSFGPDEIQRVQEFASSASEPTVEPHAALTTDAVPRLELGEALTADQLIEETPAAGSGALEQLIEEGPAAHQLIEEGPAADQLIEESPAASFGATAEVAVLPLTAADASSGEAPPQEAATEEASGAEADNADPDAALVDDDGDFAIGEEEELRMDDAGEAARPNVELQSGHKHEKLRKLNAAQQLKVARTGELADRITIERLYGKQVWDALLHNPRLSTPEVARIARKGTVPKPLLDLILENGGWIKADAVRRALLSNPKIGAEAILRLLRLTAKHELKMIEKGTAYPAPVRDAARKLLKQ
jgi:Tfp pilus assembly protein PilZ